MHKNNLAHYDLKWANVIKAKRSDLKKNPKVKVIDLDDISPKTNDIRTGTNFYMSATRQLAVDEIDFWGELSKFEIGPHSDIYSLGIMLLEVLAQNFDKAGERSFKKLLNACCQVAEEGESYDQLSSRNMHERFMKKRATMLII